MNTSHSDVRSQVNLVDSRRASLTSPLRFLGLAITMLIALYAILAAGTVWAKESKSDSKKVRKKSEITFPDYSRYKLTEDAELDKLKDDDYERIIATVKAEESAPKEPSKIDLIEDELRKIEALEKKQQAVKAKAEEERLRAEARRRSDEISAFQEELEDVREEIEDEGEDAFPVISDDEVRWNGLYE